MSERSILVREVSQVGVGEFICDVDDDTYAYGSTVDPNVYLHDEQDWQHVVAITGPVDIPTLTLAYHDGTHHTERVQASALVWVLVDAFGKPVRQDVDA